MFRTAALLSLLLVSLAHAAQPGRPNIVLVIGDDHGWPYYSFMDSPQTFATNAGTMSAQELAPTPNLQDLADSGVVFTRGYVTAAICIPSMRSLLSASGLYSVQWEERRARLKELPEQFSFSVFRESAYFRTLPRELARHGYLSWEGGKFWEGTFADAGFTNGLATVRQSRWKIVSPELTGVWFGREGWSTALCGSTGDPQQPCPALDPLRGFLDSVGSSPFFLWVSPILPHVPFDAPAEYRAPFAQLGMTAAEVGYFGNVRWFDEFLGELVGELDRRGLRQDTLIFYVSDNGWGVDLQPSVGAGRGKATPYDLGVRVPIIVSGPSNLVVPGRYDDLVLSSDIAATILSYVDGARIPPESVGQSLRPRIEGGPPVAHQRIVTHEFGDAVLEMPWRYVRRLEGGEELYDIEQDPFELVDVAAANPAIVAQLRQRADEHLAQLMQPPPRTEVLGRLVGPFGGPIAGRQLRYGHGGSRIDVVTDREGWFVVGPVPAGDAVLRSHRRGDGLGWPNAPTVTSPFSMTGVWLDAAGVPSSRDLNVPVGGRIVGRVVDAASGMPVADAMIRVKSRSPSLKLRNFTDSDGAFHLEGLPANEYRLTIKARGYRTLLLRDVAVASVDDVVTLQLQADPR